MKTRMWLVALALAACNKSQGPTMASTLNAADAAHASQFVDGFYDLEQNRWRWTGKQFNAVLGTPEGGHATNLTIAVIVTPPVVKTAPLTLSCSADGKPLKPETYTVPGSYALIRPLPGEPAGSSVRVSCQLDHTFIPGENGDNRELGIMVTRLALN